jgi:hypothetical protein
VVQPGAERGVPRARRASDGLTRSDAPRSVVAVYVVVVAKRAPGTSAPGASAPWLPSATAGLGQKGEPAQRRFRKLVGSCLLIVAALLLVGVVSRGILRHVVQTAPLWIAVVLGARRSVLTRWAALPPLVFWLVLMIVLWMHLLGLVGWITGSFSPIEIVLTVVVAAAALVGIRQARAVPAAKASSPGALAVVLGVAVLQLLAFRWSFLPGIAHD